ncbi:MAG: tetratricopeptide repeat protein [Chlorobi bacterium]|nr:tetratricopeptide repeat protein [Chlorobiota bacterium]
MRIIKYLFAFVLLALIVVSCKNDDRAQKQDAQYALESLNEKIAEQSNDFQLYAQRATIYLNQGKLDPAFRDINEAISLNPADASLYIILSDIYFVLGNKDNSISSLKKAASLDLKNPLPLIKLSEIYLMTKEYDRSQLYADRAISLNANTSKPYYYKGIAFLENNDTGNAIINLKIASNLDTANFAANMQLGAVYYETNDSLSEIYLKKALANDKGNASAIYYLGMLYQQRKDFELALDTYSRLFDNEKSSKRAYYNCGYIYLVELQDLKNAETMFKEAVKRDAAFVEAIYNLGRVYEAMGNNSIARQYYDSALMVLPNYPLAVQGLNRLDK